MLVFDALFLIKTHIISESAVWRRVLIRAVTGRRLKPETLGHFHELPLQQVKWTQACSTYCFGRCEDRLIRQLCFAEKARLQMRKSLYFIFWRPGTPHPPQIISPRGYDVRPLHNPQSPNKKFEK